MGVYALQSDLGPHYHPETGFWAIVGAYRGGDRGFWPKSQGQKGGQKIEKNRHFRPKIFRPKNVTWGHMGAQKWQFRPKRTQWDDFRFWWFDHT